MTDWIDLTALYRIVVAALIFGAGLPALFGIGLRALAHATPGSDRRTAEGGAVRPVGLAVAVVCFAAVLAAVGYGIYLIVAGS